MTDKKQTENVTFPFSFSVVRSKRRTLSVCVDRTGRVTVHAPLSLSETHIFAFLQEKSGWIEKHVSRATIAAAETPIPLCAAEGVTFPFFGKTTTIRLFPGHTGRKTPSALFAGDSLYLRDDEPEKHLTAFLKKTAKEYLSAETARIAAIMGAKYVSVSVNGARTRWGSCSYKNGLNFSYRLIYTAKETISYVVTHELAHTFEKNHSQKFWAIVEKYEPRYKELRADLKRHAHYMEIF